VLLGLTFATADGEVIEQVQRHGLVEHADTPDQREARLREARRLGFPDG
jgi:hypothetical protein